MRRLGEPDPVDAHTLFGIASNTKAFTGLALALLVEEGKVAWNQPVIRRDVGIALEDGGLVMRFFHTPLLTGDLEHWQYDTFLVRWRDCALRADAFVTFQLNPMARSTGCGWSRPRPTSTSATSSRTSISSRQRPSLGSFTGHLTGPRRGWYVETGTARFPARKGGHMARCTTLLAILAAIALPASAPGQDGPEGTPPGMESHSFTLADAVTFEPLEVPGFDSGMKLAVLRGNPTAESGTYTIRLLFPDGYRFPAHYHPLPENLTVVSGTFLIAMGTDENWDAVEKYSPGAFLYFPPEQPHYGGAEGETVIQLHGAAPFEIVLANGGD